MELVEVILDIPLWKSFDYLSDNSRKNIGIWRRVLVPFKNQKKVGFIWDIKRREKIKRKDFYREIIKVYDTIPLINEEIVSLVKFISEKYFSPLGQSIFSIIGSFALKSPILHKFEEKDVKTETSFVKKILLFSDDKLKSGTYIELIKNLKTSVIFLFPEVEIAEKYADKLKKLFGEKVLLFHSELRRKEKLNLWIEMLCKRNIIVVGTRIAVFSPLKDLGMIIIEEGNNFSYNEKQTPEYNAVEVAEYRCKKRKIPLIIGEDCLSVKEYIELKEGKIKVERVRKEEKTPHIYILQIKKNLMDKNLKFFTKETISLLEESILKKEKIGIIHSKKGKEKILFCEKCNYTFPCPNCGFSLELSKNWETLKCRYCKTEFDFNGKCPECGSKKVVIRVYGVEKIFNSIKEFYPDIKVIKITAEEKQIECDFQIVVGTKAIVRLFEKYDFGILIIVNGDTFLNLPNFRAEENFFIFVNSLMSKIKNKNCKIIIQTRNPNLEIYKSLKEKKEGIFYEKEVKIRKRLNYPPFSEIVKVKIEGRKEKVLKEKTKTIEEVLNRERLEIVFSGYSFPPVKKGKRVWEFILRINNENERDKFKKIVKEMNLNVKPNPEM